MYWGQWETPLDRFVMNVRCPLLPLNFFLVRGKSLSSTVHRLDLASRVRVNSIPRTSPGESGILMTAPSPTVQRTDGRGQG